MANISTYPIGTPSASDLLAGTELYTDSTGKQENLTRNFTVQSVASFANSYNLGYTVYTALITQTGTAAPVATVLQNTTGGTFTYARTSGGDYTVTASSSLFTANKTIVFLNGGSAENNHDIAWRRASDTVIDLKTHNSDGKFTAGSLEIRIYS
jgi:hypothetical protein